MCLLHGVEPGPLAECVQGSGWQPLIGVIGDMYPRSQIKAELVFDGKRFCPGRDLQQVPGPAQV